MRARLFASVIYYEITLFVNFVFECEQERVKKKRKERQKEGREGKKTKTGRKPRRSSLPLLIDLPEFVMPQNTVRDDVGKVFFPCFFLPIFSSPLLSLSLTKVQPFFSFNAATPERSQVRSNGGKGGEGWDIGDALRLILRHQSHVGRNPGRVRGKIYQPFRGAGFHGVKVCVFARAAPRLSFA